MSEKMGRIEVVRGKVDLSRKGRPVSIAELKRESVLRRGMANKDREPVMHVQNLEEGDKPFNSTDYKKNMSQAGDMAKQHLLSKQNKNPLGNGNPREPVPGFPLVGEIPDKFKNPPPEPNPEDFTPKDIREEPEPEEVKEEPVIAPAPFSIANAFGEDLEIEEKAQPEKDLGEYAQRLLVPSGYLYYDFRDIFARPLSFPDLCLLDAAHNAKDDSAILDVFDRTISVDIRTLLKTDLRYFFYWQRLNSYMTIPLKFEWKSIYGNVNTHTINRGTMSVMTTEKTRADLEAYPYFTFPTVKDMETYELTLAKMVEKGRDTSAYVSMVEKAQYVKGRNLKEKIDNASRLPLDVLFNDLPKFIKEFSDFRVIEEFTARDSKFKPKEALTVLKERSDALLHTAEMIASEDTYRAEDLEEVVKLRAIIEKDISRIENELANTGEAVPMNETRSFSVNIADFFPSV